MKPPHLEERRTAQFTAELRDRARAWIPSWGLADGERDFGRALLDVAARFSSEVAERLDRAADKMQRGFLDFLAVRGDAARPARMPVAFKLADTARDPVIATAPVQMQVDAGGASVVFETESDVRLLPGTLDVVVGVDAEADAVYFPPPGLSNLDPVEPLPVQWELKSFAATGAKKLQVDPEAGLAVGMIVEAAGLQYELVAVEKEIITIEPPLAAGLPAQAPLRKVTAFEPFDGAAHNRQEHALYLGQPELLDIETEATIDVVGAQSLREGVTWQFWGKVNDSDDPDWLKLTLAEKQQDDAVVLSKPKGKVEPREIGGKKSRWIRAYNTNVPPAQQPLRFDQLALRINGDDCGPDAPFPDRPSPAAEGMANTTPLVMDSVFYPLGREPRLFDAFYLACPEAFSKPGAEVQLTFGVGDGSVEAFAYLRGGPLAHRVLAGVAGDGSLNVLRVDANGVVTRDPGGPLRPPSPVPLDARPIYRPAMWESGADFFVAAAAAGTVWVWHQAADPSKSEWNNFGDVGPVYDSLEPVAGIVHLAGGRSELLAALREGKLFLRSFDKTTWKHVKTKDDDEEIELASIAPIVQDSSGHSLAGIGVNQKLYTIDAVEGTCTFKHDNVAPEIAPAAIESAGNVLIVAVDATTRHLVSSEGEDQQLDSNDIIGHFLDVNFLGIDPTFALCLRLNGGQTALEAWAPTPRGALQPVRYDIPGDVGIAAGPPALLPPYAVVPAASGQVLSAALISSVVVGVAEEVDVTWTPYLDAGSSATNPTLSWEYANGTGWWKLDPLHDETLNLKHGGDVRFTVPDDLRPMDWAGRTSYWIRARLIGGDFGKEIVTVTSVTDTSRPPKTTQTIERSSAGIRAPSVTSLRIAYRLCTSTRPAFVLAQDSGSIRDQSEANLTQGAIVEAFVPIAAALERLSASAPAGRAIFVGLNATPSGAPVNVFLLVEKESPYEAFAPMKIEALVADRFVPVVADDPTRALGESGVLSMAFALPPTPREMFGRENLTWLRLSPGGDAPQSDWKPKLRGAYLNAVFASAAETMTRELLGSSDGRPNLTVFLARPPLLRDTLELRVKEPLGDEERAALGGQVLNDSNLPGDWVLWQQVIDPGDEAAAARVYALDETTGEIRFGDGQHGAIPPIGTDSIVGFSYKRTELGNLAGGDVPGNSVKPRAALNLISPIDTVESVAAADQAAGGAPPESNERVLRFGTARLRHRERALTARDFEDLALESSPDIVQARCFTGRSGVRLIVVMRGVDPLPNAAEIRELERLLLAAAPASLSAPDAFRVTGAGLRRLRIVLELRLASLDHAGEVSRAVEQRIAALFDTASWPLGAEPKDEDIARAIIDTPRLEGLGDVELRGSDAVKRDELVMLDADPLRLAFKTVEVIS